MAFVTKLSIDGNEAASPTWNDVEHSLRGLKQNKDSWISIGDQTDENWLVVYFIPSYGYYVSGCGLGDIDYYTLVDRNVAADVVDVYLAGDVGAYTRNSFVDEATTLEALQTFFETGSRKASLSWELTTSVMKD